MPYPSLRCLQMCSQQQPILQVSQPLMCILDALLLTEMKCPGLPERLKAAARPWTMASCRSRWLLSAQLSTTSTVVSPRKFDFSVHSSLERAFESSLSRFAMVWTVALKSSRLNVAGWTPRAETWAACSFVLTRAYVVPAWGGQAAREALS